MIEEKALEPLNVKYIQVNNLSFPMASHFAACDRVLRQFGHLSLPRLMEHVVFPRSGRKKIKKHRTIIP